MRGLSVPACLHRHALSQQEAWAKSLCLILSLIPLTALVWNTVDNPFDANPLETLIRGLGLWGLTFLLLTLAVSPLHQWLRWGWLPALRRLLGLMSFGYAAAHFLVYLWLDQGLDWRAIADDLLYRPFITAGLLAFVLLTPLACTSSDKAIRCLGRQNWQRLHQAVYLIALAAVLHFWWLVKVDTRRPAIYALILLGLLLARHFRCPGKARG